MLRWSLRCRGEKRLLEKATTWLALLTIIPMLYLNAVFFATGRVFHQTGRR
jgi:hypothetical protein